MLWPPGQQVSVCHCPPPALASGHTFAKNILHLVLGSPGKLRVAFKICLDRPLLPSQPLRLVGLLL